jgi:hypothetical protein
MQKGGRQCSAKAFISFDVSPASVYNYENIVPVAFDTSGNRILAVLW